MKRIITLTILLTLTICSCDITKQASKNKTDTELAQNYEKIEKRDGGNAIFIPQTNTIYKDTIIYVQGTKGTDLKIIYDKQGNLQSADCNGALIDVITKISTDLNQQTKEKQSEKTEKFNTTWFLYLIIGIVVLGIVAMIIIMRSVNKNSTAITSLINALNNRNLDNKI